ncbi:MAG: aminoacyl-tRNA hydrolase [Anaerolineae bacterium]|nr:MAG: aminoacyl-tRNA hydrolase [Anaerolineae bacterium]
MYLLVGLGNPGLTYQNNRHNVGFMVVDEIARMLGESFTRVESRALVTKTDYQGRRIVLAKPRTYMNLSGQAVQGLSRFYKIPLEQILIIYDDADLPFETIRIRPDGSAAGQKGMKSIIEHLGTDKFPRLRVGIDRPPGKMSTPDYVLQDFSKDQLVRLPLILEQAAQAALYFVINGITSSMNQFNRTEI